MATALTGSLGAPGSQPGLLQLGGPPLINSFGRALPSDAPALLGHAYANDGVTPNPAAATFTIENAPSLKTMTTNGGQSSISLEVPSPVTGLTQGNVVRLTEVGGSFRGFVYGGIVVALPDSRSSGATKHEIALAPFGAELGKTYSQAVYDGSNTDLSQAIREAVALTQHCSCDQVSVPVATGIALAQSDLVDFRNQSVQQILDTCRSIAGPTWFWFCDELGRVWFQPQGSGAIYTVPQSQYSERLSNGGSIENLINKVPAVGGVPTGGSLNVTSSYDGASQAVLGIQALHPALQIPNITDQVSLDFIAQNVGLVLDRVWNRLQVKIEPTFGSRVHGSQPGGGVLRTWEPTKTPLAESDGNVTTAAQSYPLQVAADWAAAYWRLGEAVGSTSVAEPVSGLLGQTTGTVTFGQTGALSGDTNTAALFNGTTGYISFGPAARLVRLFQNHDFTIEMWINPTAVGSYFFGCGLVQPPTPDSFVHVGFFGATNKLQFDFYQDGLTGVSSIPTGSWTHVAFTWKATTQARAIYVNGLLDASDVSTGILNVPSASEPALARLFFNTGNGPYFYSGKLDEVAVYGGALTAAQVAKHYQLGTTGPVAASNYSAPYIVQEVTYDGLTQDVTAGDAPVASQTDIDHMVQALVGRTAANSVQVTAAALNLPQQVLSGSFQSGPGSAGVWGLNSTKFFVNDETGVTRLEQGNLAANGISGAGWKYRGNAADGSPIFDSDGLIGVMQVLAQLSDSAADTMTSTTSTVLGGMTTTFTLARQVNLLLVAVSTGKTTGGSGALAQGKIFIDGNFTNPPILWDHANPGYTSGTIVGLPTLAAGSHTIDFRINVDSGQTWFNYFSILDIFQLGG